MKSDLAKKLAEFAHHGQKYGSNEYCQYHLAGVVRIAETHNLASDENIDDVRTVAWLHDILEDTHITEELIFQHFGESVATAVVLLTKSTGYNYDDYIHNICQNRLAWIVKIADTLFNLNESALMGNVKRTKKYSNQLNLLISSGQK